MEGAGSCGEAGTAVDFGPAGGWVGAAGRAGAGGDTSVMEVKIVPGPKMTYKRCRTLRYFYLSRSRT